ncbi:hypothetical protein LQ318_13725 [Aliifodinibius salicampi]|uniref:ZIP family metal transporter n=1 Tax=Fodinibius salicampi TaxID=1920655 RepID=A0ABT3Q1H1_9BACT|nr:hypothetical protein [Fodinibius salicampi]MCW9713965.1 hypothetical protein [Fodinibius salicampi]
MSELLQHPTAQVFLYALITAVATGLGALPFFFFEKLTRSWLGISNAIASGLMLAASFGLIYEGLNYDLWFTFYGIIIGLIPRGTSPLKAAWWSVFSSLPQPLMAVPAFIFVEIFRDYLPVGLGFAGGAMIWMVFAEVIPDAMEENDASIIATAITISVALMIVFQVLIG